MKTLRTFAIVGVLELVEVSVSRATVLLQDDFESGTLSQWTIGGRQQGVNSAAVVTHSGSQVGYLHHEDYTEITIENSFAYDPNLAFSFDMEAHAASSLPPNAEDYAAGAATFVFRDAGDVFLGWAWYARATSSVPTVIYNTPTSLWASIPDEAMHSYTFTVQDILTQLPGVDEGTIATVEFGFRAYGSGWADVLTADVYVDNVEVSLIPEPSMLCLLGIGGAAVFRRRRYAAR